jgi:hypothetical protein
LESSAEGGISGAVPPTLSLTLGAPGSLGTFYPGVSQEYTASTAATVVSTATTAELSVRDPSFTFTGRLVNRNVALYQPLEVSATNAANPSGAFAPLPTDRSPVRLLSFPGPVSQDSVTIGFRQAIGAHEALLTGSYGKTLVFTLSTNTP